jgi:uncharacterized protein (DUF4415 family)
MKSQYNFKTMKNAEPKYIKRLKETVTIRLDPQVIAYFKGLSAKTDIPYQSLVNYVLRDYAMLGLEPSANWSAPKSKTRKKAG